MPVKLLNPHSAYLKDMFEAVVLDADDSEDRPFITVDYDIDDYVQFTRTTFDPYDTDEPHAIRYHSLAMTFEDLEALVDQLHEFRRKKEEQKAPFRKARQRVLDRVIVETVDSVFQFPATEAHITIHPDGCDFEKTVKYLNLANELKGNK